MLRKSIGLVAVVLSLSFSISSCDLLIAQETDSTSAETVPGEELPDLEERLRAVEGMEKKAGDEKLSLHELVKQRKYAELLGRIRAGEDPNSVDEKGQTPLHVAVSNYHLTIAMILIENGADINIKDQQNQSPIDLVNQGNDKEDAQRLVSLMQKRAALVKAGKHKVARPQKTRPVSVWLEPLKKHHAQLKKIDERFKALGALQNPPPKEDVKKQGELLVNATQSACAFLDQYTNTNRGPRRGLQEERQLVQEMRSMVERSTIMLKQLSQLQLPQDEDPNYEKRTAPFLQAAATDYLKQAVANRLEREGLGEFLKEEHVGRMQEKTVKRLELDLQGYFDKQLQQRIGIRLNDLKSLKAAARAKVRFHVRQEVAKLVVDISSNRMVIRLAQQIVLVLLEEQLWPMIRESLRPKGNLEERTHASVDTLMESCEELVALSNTDPAKVDLRKARRVFARAEGRLNAMRYLLKDAKRAKRKDLLDELEIGRNLLTLRYNLVAYQFMLTQDNEVVEQVTDENTIMKGLLEIVRYLVGHISESQLVLQGSSRTETSSTFGFSPTVLEFDQERYQSDKLGTPGVVIDRKRYYKVWEKEYVVRNQIKGRTIYTYRFWRPARGGQMMPRLGNHAWLCGMTPGKHVVQARVVTLDGEVYDFEYELNVDPVSQRNQDSLKRAYDKVKSGRSRFQRANTTQKKAQAARYYSSALTSFMYSYMRNGGEKSCQVDKYLAECNTVADWLLKAEEDRGRTLEAHYIKVMGAMCEICRQQGTAESFEKAKQYTAQAENVQARPGLKVERALSTCYGALKDMSVSIFNDIPQGRQYHEKYIQAQLKAGINLIGIDWVRSEFPKQIKVPEKTKEVTTKE
ncbi:ankyrin repeat domain-containing protein [Gimesia alba]|uniref:ankyrin repeat domain-containing protein n=1 Tax=Gimesia alba TaxID=2527973 RepID=UPI00119E2801|nr:ankyrin repeat domain-containing protein [Gimesia alba]